MSLISYLPTPNLSPPILSPGFAVGASTLFTLAYVGSLYLSRSGRITHAKDSNGDVIDRDHPTVIKARMKTASFSTALTLLASGAILWCKGVVPRSGWLIDTLNISRLLGLPLPTPSLLTSNTLPFSPSLSAYLSTLAAHITYPLLLTATLFLGPLYTLFLDRELSLQSHFDFHRDVVQKFTTLAGIRNFLIGPLTEELVFRSSLLPLLIFAGVGRGKLIFASPLLFGVAHVHHAYNVYLNGGRTKQAAIRGGVIATVQLGYSMVFGWFASFVWLRSGSVWGGFAAHVWCNVMGLPNPINDSERHPRRKPHIWLSHALGIAMFAKLLFPLTSPSLLGRSLYWA